MSSTRQIKTKLHTVRNIGQITKAMEMVAATKMRRSQELALKARPYAKKALDLLSAISQYQDEQKKSVFFEQRQEGKECLIVITSDKGLAGSFNSQVLRLASQWKERHPQADVVAVGRKGRDFFRNRGMTPAAEFLQFSDTVTLEDVRPLAQWIEQHFERGAYKNMTMVSSKFVSALTQKPQAHQLLPLTMEGLKEVVEGIIPKTGRYSDWQDREEESAPLYLLEPSPQVVFETLVRELIHVEVLHFVYESNAAEHSARMIAMKNATENATELQEELQLELNKARQAAITQELTEIATAKEALTTE